uniref:Integrase catalytic domain-containing protein n=1 Tax=Schistosoma curassoni TaxID=6186 RepID=A0A183JRE9_9TREM
LNGIECKHVFIAPRQPCSNGQAKNFVRTLKTAINSIAASTFNELERGVDIFLLQYKNVKRSVTKETPSKLLKRRVLRSNMRCFESPEVEHYRGNDLRPATGIVVKNVGKSMVRFLDINYLSTHNRHVEQIRFQEPGESIPISVVNSNTNEYILDNTESISNTLSDRHMMNLRRESTIDYRNLDYNLSCGGCGVGTN